MKIIKIFMKQIIKYKKYFISFVSQLSLNICVPISTLQLNPFKYVIASHYISPLIINIVYIYISIIIKNKIKMSKI
jgi:hypothetical protein